MQNLYAFYTNQASNGEDWDEANALVQLENGLAKEMEALRSIHWQCLQTLFLWAELDANREKETLHSSLRHLQTNEFLTLLRENESYPTLAKRYPLLLPKDLLELLYYEQVSKDPQLITYKEKEKGSYREEVKIIKHLLNQWIFLHQGLQSEVTKLFINWDPNSKREHKHLLSLIKKLKAHPTKALDHYYNPYDQEEAFYRRLVKTVHQQETQHRQKIIQASANWELNRIFFLDQILLKMGLTELLHFEEIPPNVTINEYIEIAKQYSNPKSYQFIHGLLNHFTQENQPQPDS